MSDTPKVVRLCSRAETPGCKSMNRPPAKKRLFRVRVAAKFTWMRRRVLRASRRASMSPPRSGLVSSTLATSRARSVPSIMATPTWEAERAGRR